MESKLLHNPARGFDEGRKPLVSDTALRVDIILEDIRGSMVVGRFLTLNYRVINQDSTVFVVFNAEVGVLQSALIRHHFGEQVLQLLREPTKNQALPSPCKIHLISTDGGIELEDVEVELVKNTNSPDAIFQWQGISKRCLWKSTN